jgi:hypothetical protein
MSAMTDTVENEGEPRTTSIQGEHRRRKLIQEVSGQDSIVAYSNSTDLFTPTFSTVSTHLRHVWLKTFAAQKHCSFAR